MPSRYICRVCRREIPHAGSECPHCNARTALRVGATPQVLIVVFAVMTALFALTQIYAREFHRQSAARGQTHFRIARTLAAYGYFEQAIEEYRDALSYSRDEFDYRLGLALTLYLSRRFGEAEQQLLQIRAIEPTHAQVNLLLARAARRSGRWSEAENYYRTAIYGRWPRNADENRLRTRFALVDLLEEAGRGLPVVTELLTILDEEAWEPDLARRIAYALLEFDAPRGAVRVLRQVLKAQPNDRQVLAALGKAEFQLGNYAAARQAFRRSRLYRDDDEIARQLEICEEILRLDPTNPRIGGRERYRRGREILGRTLTYLNSCVNPFGAEFAGPPAPQPPAVEKAFRQAREQYARTGRPRDYDQGVQDRLAAAEQLWAARASVCTNIWDEDEALARVLEKLGR